MSASISQIRSWANAIEDVLEDIATGDMTKLCRAVDDLARIQRQMDIANAQVAA